MLSQDALYTVLYVSLLPNLGLAITPTSASQNIDYYGISIVKPQALNHAKL